MRALHAGRPEPRRKAAKERIMLWATIGERPLEGVRKDV
jgi:hypothetical protein